MPRFVRNGSFALSLLVLAACGDTTAPAPQSVAEARALWAAHNLTTYSYFGTQTCFCAVPSGLVRVDVLDGNVSAVTDMTAHAQIPSAGWLTIDALFDLAETLQPRPVEFDRYLGYPKRVERCCLADDSGSVYTVSSLYLIPISF
jgi:hypothetical protein